MFSYSCFDFFFFSKVRFSFKSKGCLWICVFIWVKYNMLDDNGKCVNIVFLISVGGGKSCFFY